MYDYKKKLEKGFKRLGFWVIRCRLIILLLTVVVAGAAITQLPKLSIATSVETLFGYPTTDEDGNVRIEPIFASEIVVTGSHIRGAEDTGALVKVYEALLDIEWTASQGSGGPTHA